MNGLRLSRYSAGSTTAMIYKDFREFVELLIDKKVEYLIVGGYAVAFHGHPRYTGDLDIWIRISEENAAKILHVLDDFGFSSLGLRPEDFLTPGNIIQLGYPPVRIDILTTVDGVEFTDCYSRRLTVTHSGLELTVIGLECLKTNKRAAGRPGDLADLAKLDG
ncbi:hypothetical protein [Candidatus Magnetominusculus xianensis]|uniref:Nucleotidyltransferase family protein n=1 Tax=Candidatus Magnetominusculus xianensis TaxID=1748249 RepID=A0ABR5SDE8_9BACT|nr:hypothetical protein [Candidatus Magnetominusculus xianensis]KWT79576.1 hypothetical protein ASN18_2746 [Candidatus Magnetominusculus xianensis]